MMKDTRTTREADAGRNTTNRKPYRTAEQKKLARATATQVDGRWVSDAPVSYHGARR
jgi:hypothetical protein